MKWIGLTGPTGAGKSTLLHGLSTLPVRIVDADKLYHTLLAENQGLCQALCQAFGNTILNEDGGIQRKALGSVVFGDTQKLEQLNQITHSFITEEMHRQSNLAQQEGYEGFIIDAIRLVESGLGTQCSAIIGILAPAELRVARIMKRDGISEDYAKSRIAAQPSDDFYHTHCTYVLENTDNHGGEALAQQGRTLVEEILK